MIRLEILSGKMAGDSWSARHFPVQIGRDAACDLRLEESGVWDRHAELKLDREEGYMLDACKEAIVSVNGKVNATTRLRNGDLVSVGSVQLRFWLADTRQRSVAAAEFGVWLLVALVTVSEVLLVYKLLG